MKKITLFFISAFFALQILAQAPQTFKYQAVARDNAGNTLNTQSVSFRISILQGSTGGPSVYTETHAATTNQFGLVTLNIGNGVVVSGTFSSITWATNTYFIKTELDPLGGTAYQVMGTTQLVSVPYALYADKAGSLTTTNQDVYEVYGTGQLQVTSSVTTMTLIPGLTQTINVPAGCKAIVSTDGGMQCTATGNAFSVVDFAIFVDGTQATQAGNRRVVAANTTGIAQVVANWSFGKTYSLTAGNHTFEVKAAFVVGSGGSTANVSSAGAPQIQGVMTVAIIKQ
ncbi:MAG: hypothetical protein IAF38_17305 [Bacteroidia bacterium]|nr:hypothetical protein [Bacteroidia bacterium]